MNRRLPCTHITTIHNEMKFLDSSYTCAFLEQDNLVVSANGSIRVFENIEHVQQVGGYRPL